MDDTIEAIREQTASTYVLGLRDELAEGTMQRLATANCGALEIEICLGEDSIWVIARRQGSGGLALRAAYAPSGNLTCRCLESSPGEPLGFEVESPLGSIDISVETSESERPRLRVQTRLRPATALRIPFLPRDLYVLDANDDPLGTKGNIEASQRGVNTGLVYFRVTNPGFGSVLYVQNFTTLNPYFKATGAVPSGVVGGEWPELGYQPPVTKPDTGAADPLPAGETIPLSDATLVFSEDADDDEQAISRQFLQMLGVVYDTLALPDAHYRDWRWRAERTLEDLEHAPVATLVQYGHRYVMPYVQGEVPDAMVQMSVISALNDLGKWRGAPVPLAAELADGLEEFYDPDVATLRRYLPNIGDIAPDKDADAVDSWYLYHPMINLARLAQDGDTRARDLLLRSVDFGIRAAHHFDYKWPILYKIHDFEVITETRGDKRFGETDVNGIYAYLMVQLYDLTGDDKYVEEASKAIRAAKGLRFDLMYQANLSVWGAVACLRLRRIKQDDDYLAQSYVYLAGVFHNCEIWKSEIGNAAQFHNFLGVTCLHDAPYMAMYECFECFAGLEEYLANSDADLEPAIRMLIAEFCRYALDRAWFYFPDVLPEDILYQEKPQSGILDRALSFPLEDLYGDGQSPGQIGQEIYGCGGAFVYATRAFHRVEEAPFTLFCNHFVRAMDRTGEQSLSIQLDGGETCTALISLVPEKDAGQIKASIRTADGDKLLPHDQTEGRVDFHVPANGRLVLAWE